MRTGTHKGFTFAVDDVAPATERLAEGDGAIETIVGQPLLVSSRTRPLVDTPAVREALTRGEHGLLVAVHTAFSDHRPLVLSPDAIWLTLAQGFALHVREHADALRDRYVRHAGRKTLRVDTLDFTSVAAWETHLAAFHAGLAAELGKGVTELVSRPFSTTGPTEQAVSRVVLMDAFQRYFDYELYCICGIPEITLRGTPDDWRDVRARVRALADHDLGWWVAELEPLCDQWVATAEGRPDREFWQSIYKPEATYGTRLVTGWLIRLFPYLSEGERFVRNEFRRAERVPEGPLDFHERFRRWKARGQPTAPQADWSHAGISTARIPGGLSRATVRLREGSGDRWLDVVAGFVGVGQVEGELAIEPRLEWAVCEAARERLWDALASRISAGPAVVAPESFPLSRPALLEELLDRFGPRPLLDGRLQFLSRRELAHVHLTPTDGDAVLTSGVRFADLADGSFLALLWERGRPSECPVVHVPAGGPHEPARISVVARSMGELLDKLADPGELYFLHPGAALHGSLADLREP